MIEKMNLDEECEFFTAERLNEIVMLRLKENLLFRATDLSVKNKVPDYLDPASRTDYIKAVFLISSLEA